MEKMSTETWPDRGQLLDMAGGFRAACVFGTAAELDLFTRLGDRSLTAEAITTEIEGDSAPASCSMPWLPFGSWKSGMTPIGCPRPCGPSSQWNATDALADDPAQYEHLSGGGRNWLGSPEPESPHRGNRAFAGRRRTVPPSSPRCMPFPAPWPTT